MSEPVLPGHDGHPPPLGVLLAGGRGRRLGGGKAVTVLAGRPMALWALDALRAVCDQVVVAAKGPPDPSLLPPLPAGVARWDEPPEPRHPLAGLVAVMVRAGGRPVLCCPVDLPLIDPDTLRVLLGARGNAPAVVAAGPTGEAQPLLGLYESSAVPTLRRAPDGVRVLRWVLDELEARLVPVAAEALRNVNRPEDLAAARAALSRR